jgi:D-alanyl-lipoteichoic acid acyltransferase DltB (MBOAT superfamily)
MVFNSIVFIIFLASLLLTYYSVPKKFKWAVLFVASNIFVGYASIESLVILYIITFTSFFGGKYIISNNKIKQKPLFYSLLFVVIGFLVIFKYTPLISYLINYFSEIFFGTKLILSVSNLILPLGLSFYTFQSIGYLISIYRGQYKPIINLPDFLLFMFFFPKLLAGPIERVENFIPQIKNSYTFNEVKFNYGVKLFILGLFKKIVIADRIAMYVDVVYGGYEQFTSLTFIIAAFLYVIQIYADFSGYTDMARGVASLFGITLLENFNRPILAQNIAQFWRKWHMSLTSWATDYVYYPIVVKRRDWNNFGVFYATLFTFLLIGIWHGSSLNFIVFGLLQVFLIFFDYLIMKRRKKFRKKLKSQISIYSYRFISWAITIVVITFSMMIFRITNFQQFMVILSKVSNFSTQLYLGTPAYFIYSIFGVFIIFAIDIWEEFYGKTFLFRNSKYMIVKQLPYVFFIVLILLIGVFDGGQFIYVQY